jgi:hypothetical protein
MANLHTDDTAPRLFECDLDRSQTKIPDDYLPDAPGVLIAGEDMLRAAGYVPGSNRPRGWKPANPGAFTKPSRDGVHTLRVRQCGHAKDKDKLWIIERSSFADIGYRKIEALVFGFGQVPIWARTYQAAMRLAEHCDPFPCPPTAGCWTEVYTVHFSADM